ncbi:serine/threonine-protein kinase [Sorangium sp. So ce1151]|uniref:serine/threonine-protein kinase n=1 Tax=Sorangium sp. So ce1151 TaxID=3133332 RepID=UPI003F62FC54
MASRSRSIVGAGDGAGLRAFDASEPGEVLDGRYELISHVGEGAFGEVWTALDLRVGLTVAVKLAKSGASAERFEEEVKLLASLQHPGVVTLRDQWDASSPDARPFFVMDYCESNLKRWIAEATSGGSADLDAVRTIFLDVCRTVSFVHERGKLHRDLKPSNILLLRDGDRLFPKLADFGQAGEVPDVDRTATEGLGTAFYQSPEQGLLGRAPSPASDVFSLAVVLYEMLTGQPTPDPARPWWKIVASAGLSPSSLEASARALEALRGTLSARLPEPALRVLVQALSLDPQARPSALELGTMFDEALRGRPVVTRRWRSSPVQAEQGGMSRIIPISNSFGYLFAALPPVFLDPQLKSRLEYGARTYPNAWLMVPLCAFVFIGTRLVFRYVDIHKRWWMALVPLLVAAAATTPILAPEVPHGTLVGNTPLWLGVTGVWLATHYAFNQDGQASFKPYVAQSLRFLFAGALLTAGVAPIPFMLFSHRIYEHIVTAPADVSLLYSWSYFQSAILELLWLMGPTREVGVAWFRALRAAPPGR